MLLTAAEILRLTLVVLLCVVTAVFGIAAIGAGRWKSWFLFHLALMAVYGLATSLCQPATAVAATLQIAIAATRIFAVWEVASDAFAETEEWRRRGTIVAATIFGVLVAVATYRPYYDDALWNWRVSWECGTAVMAVLLVGYYWTKLFPMPAIYRWYGLTWGVFVASYAGNAALAPEWGFHLWNASIQYTARSACLVGWMWPLATAAGRNLLRGQPGRLRVEGSNDSAQSGHSRARGTLDFLGQAALLVERWVVPTWRRWSWSRVGYTRQML